ncbi:MAG: hypothetical protein IKB35_04570, partial [Clostridia bacterium]|nr:hypothetical protein [Clostridia bacterium]
MKKTYRKNIEYNSVKELITLNAVNHPETVVFSYRNKPTDSEAIEITLSQLLCDVKALGTELLALELKNKHCAVIGKLSYNWIRIYLSLLSIGAVVVPLDRDW